MSKANSAPAPVSDCHKPSEPDGANLDTIAEHALAAIAARFTKASGAVQELFDDYTRQAQALRAPAQGNGKTPDVTTDDESSTSL